MQFIITYLKSYIFTERMDTC